MPTKYLVRQLGRNEYASAPGMRFAIYELTLEGAQRVALFYEEAEACHVCKALQQFSERGTKPLGSNRMYSMSVAEN
jgi:hypothetical protein